MKSIKSWSKVVYIFIYALISYELCSMTIVKSSEEIIYNEVLGCIIVCMAVLLTTTIGIATYYNWKE